MEPSLYSDLNDWLLSGLKDWSTEDIPFEIEGVQHNLVDYMGPGCAQEGNELLFPEAHSMDMNKPYNDQHNRKKREDLVRSLKIAASEAGFTLVTKGWECRDSTLR